MVLDFCLMVIQIDYDINFVVFYKILQQVKDG